MITKEEIITYLIDANVYDDTDEYLIDQFIDNLEMKQLAKEEIQRTGLLITQTRRNGETYLAKSPAVAILDSCTKNLLSISRKLGLSPFDRATLKIQLNDLEDGF